jgi:mxaJ protein
MIEDLIAGRIDVALVWGPIAGYFQKKKRAPFLKLVPIDDKGAGDAGTRFAFDISMGVRKADKELRARLDEALARKHDDIAKILEDYGVPLLPLAGTGP